MWLWPSLSSTSSSELLQNSSRAKCEQQQLKHTQTNEWRSLPPIKHMPSSPALLKDFQPGIKQLKLRVFVLERVHRYHEWMSGAWIGEEAVAVARLKSRKGLSNMLRGVFNLKCLTRHFILFKLFIYLRFRININILNRYLFQMLAVSFNCPTSIQ